MNDDEQYLRLLSIFHYVVGGLAACFACIFFIHFGIGIAMLTGAIDEAPAFVGLIFVVMSMVAIAMGWVFAGCLIVAGKNLVPRPATGKTALRMGFSVIMSLYPQIIL